MIPLLLQLFSYQGRYNTQALYHLQTLRHTHWLRNITQTKGTMCVRHVARAEVSCNATSLQHEATKPLGKPLCLPAPEAIPRVSSLRNKPAWRTASCVSGPECLWSRLPTSPGLRRGVWHSRGGSDWSHPSLATGWPSSPSAAKPSITCTPDGFLSWFYLHTLRYLPGREASL